MQKAFVCLVGSEFRSQDEWISWSLEDPSRFLKFVSQNEASLALIQQKVIGLKNIECIALDSPLQIEPLAKRLAWEAVFLEADVIEVESQDWYSSFLQYFQLTHLGAHALLSDGVDLGVGIARQTLLLQHRSFRKGVDLKNRFQKVPAVIVGAGASLDTIMPDLEKMEPRALFFVGGSALQKVPFQPHFAASIDAQAPYNQMKQFSFWETPFCVQTRTNPEFFSLFHGELLLFPESHLSFVNWLTDQESFDGGWTVANVLTSIALLLGCDPICFAGIDLCYQGEMKYGKPNPELLSRLIEVETRSGKKVWTQPDWLLSRDWMEQLAIRHPERSFIDLTGEGLGFKKPIATMSPIFPEKENLRKKVHDEIMKLPLVSFDEIRLRLWKTELKKALDQCSQFIMSEGKQDWVEEGEVYEMLLEPLWNLWKTVFERAMPSSQIQKAIFFQQVLEEHQAIYE